MKKMMSVLLMLAAVGCGVSSARSENRVAVIRSGEVFKLIYKSEEPSSVKVAISDEDGTQVFSEELISMHGFIRPYNFSQLPKGDYTISVTDNSGKKSKRISLNNSKPWGAHISSLQPDNKRIMVAVQEQQPNTDFSIEILDQDDVLVYSENRKAETEYAKVFNLKNLEKGSTVNLINHVTGEIKSFRVD